MMTHETATAYFATQTPACRNAITKTVRAFQRQVKAGVVLPAGLVEEVARAVADNTVSTVAGESWDYWEYLVKLMQQPLAN